MKKQRVIRSMLKTVQNFLMFFLLVAFVVTCSFLLFFSAIDMLAEEEIRAFAPLVFFNVIAISIIFTCVDRVRRYITLDLPMRELENVQKRLMNGDFSARVNEKYCNAKYREIGRVAKGINTLAEELSGVETLRTDFISNVSHEMKTPLAVMQNYGSMLQAPDLSNEKRIEYARSVTEGSKRLAELMTNILKLNRLENQQIYPQLTEYNLGEQLCECLLGFESVWEENDISIETDIEEDVFAAADRELLAIVWNNLLSNAFKFTQNGGTVSLTLKSDGKDAVISVRDTGIGMTQEVGKHIFDKFYQGDQSRATKGNGLGLALVKRVVDIVGGEISVESVLGEGSTFTVRIRRKS